MPKIKVNVKTKLENTILEVERFSLFRHNKISETSEVATVIPKRYGKAFAEIFKIRSISSLFPKRFEINSGLLTKISPKVTTTTTNEMIKAKIKYKADKKELKTTKIIKDKPTIE